MATKFRTGRTSASSRTDSLLNDRLHTWEVTILRLQQFAIAKK